MTDINREPNSNRKSDLVRKLDEELGNVASFQAPVPRQSRANPDPYMRMDYDGHTLFVSTILENQEKALKLIAAMTAMVPFLPKEGD